MSDSKKTIDDNKNQPEYEALKNKLGGPDWSELKWTEGDSRGEERQIQDEEPCYTGPVFAGYRNEDTGPKPSGGATRSVDNVSDSSKSAKGKK